MDMEVRSEIGWDFIYTTSLRLHLSRKWSLTRNSRNQDAGVDPGKINNKAIIV